VGGLTEHAVHRRQRRAGMPQRLGAIGRLFLAAEHPDDAPLWVEAHDHVRAFVDGPDVIVRVDAYAVRFGPRVEALADLADEFPVLIELEELRRRGTECGTR